MTELEFLQQARWLAERRGYKASWCYVIFRERYGRWPGKLLKHAEPSEAGPEFLAWLEVYWDSTRLREPAGPLAGVASPAGSAQAAAAACPKDSLPIAPTPGTRLLSDYGYCYTPQTAEEWIRLWNRS